MSIKNILAATVLALLVTALPCMAEVNEVDSNFDGKIDQWQYVDAQGKVVKIEYDGDFDSKVDQIEHYKGEKILHYMGTSTFSNFTVLPEISLAKVRKDAPFDKICYIGCGVTTGIGAVMFTAKVEPNSTAVVFGLGGIGLNVLQGLRMIGARQIVGVDLNPAREALGKQFGMTHFVNPKDHDDLVGHLVELTGGGADYSFECIGNVDVMRDALECVHKGWGESVIIGVAPAGAEIQTRPFQLVTGRVWRGSAFGGARGRTDVPKIVDMYMHGRIDIDSLITHKMPLEDINKAFDLMHEGKSIRSVVEF